MVVFINPMVMKKFYFVGFFLRPKASIVLSMTIEGTSMVNMSYYQADAINYFQNRILNTKHGRQK